MAGTQLGNEIDSMQKVIVYSLRLMERNLFQYKKLREQCDVLIRPHFPALGVGSLTDFNNMDVFYASGRAAGEAALPAILKALAD